MNKITFIEPKNVELDIMESEEDPYVYGYNSGSLQMYKHGTVSK